MSEITLGILGGGQLGSLLSVAAKKLNIKTIVYCDDQDAPAQNFCDEFICAKYDVKNKLYEFAQKTDVITFDYCKEKNINGDIFISTERVKENAKTYNTNYMTELYRVMVHGLLHLHGYKDKSREEKELMKSKENYYISIK